MPLIAIYGAEKLARIKAEIKDNNRFFDVKEVTVGHHKEHGKVVLIEGGRDVDVLVVDYKPQAGPT